MCVCVCVCVCARAHALFACFVYVELPGVFLSFTGSHHYWFHFSPKEEGPEDGLLFWDPWPTSVRFLVYGICSC